MTDATRLTRCPCGWRGTLGECEVLGADDGRVFCPRCFREFEPVAVAARIDATTTQGVRPVKLKWSNVDWDDWHCAEIPDGKHLNFATVMVSKVGKEYEMNVSFENVRDHTFKAKTLRAAKAEAVAVLRAHVARMIETINSIEETT